VGPAKGLYFFYMSLALDKLGERAKAIERAALRRLVFLAVVIPQASGRLGDVELLLADVDLHAGEAQSAHPCQRLAGSQVAPLRGGELPLPVVP